MKHGDEKLAQICGTIAADEKCHETAYTKMAGKLFELDPNETVMAFADMMRKKISIPAHLMYDGHDENLFYHFANVASRIGVYTARDYGEILEHLVGIWGMECDDPIFYFYFFYIQNICIYINLLKYKQVITVARRYVAKPSYGTYPIIYT
jgi:hypothetical protein